MQIDWFTLVAQVINFLVLMWLLRRYLYKPILKAIDERESKIVAQLKDAESKKKEALKERVEFNKKNEKFDSERDELMQKVIDESKEQKKKLTEKARLEANALKKKLDDEILANHAAQKNEIEENIQREVLEIARKTLADLSSVDLEKQMVRTFVAKVNQLGKEEKEKFVSTLASGKDSILVQSAFDLSKTEKSEIEKEVNSLTKKEYDFEFKVTPKLISGIELSANGYKLSWTISEYIHSFENELNAPIQDKKDQPSDKK
ncbi:MAG: F0F1 ATP synthase subunit B [Cyclobacteriaceae bacterium]|nr:F0F1 ATP synthase subunit B [Cyclobacteriaceae bacterium]